MPLFGVFFKAEAGVRSTAMHTNSTDETTALRLAAVIADMASRGINIELDVLIKHLARKGRAA